MVKKCEDCKHSRFMGLAFVSPRGIRNNDSTKCNLRNKEVHSDEKCWRFIHKKGKVVTLQNHWLKHWKFWIGSFLLGLIGIIVSISK